MDNAIAYKRIILLIGCIAISAAVFFVPEKMMVASDIYTDLLTVISILCGVLIAVISILGAQPNKLSSQGAILYKHATDSKMIRLRLQFYLYLLVIVTALLCTFLNGHEVRYSILLYKATTFLGAFSILTSFSLPKLLSDAFQHTRQNAP